MQVWNETIDRQRSHAEAQVARERPLPPYVPPTITTYTEEELLEALGPAQAGSVGGDNVFGQ